jgi:hypothetical protein
MPTGKLKEGSGVGPRYVSETLANWFHVVVFSALRND